MLEYRQRPIYTGSICVWPWTCTSWRPRSGWKMGNNGLMRALLSHVMTWRLKRPVPCVTGGITNLDTFPDSKEGSLIDTTDSPHRGGQKQIIDFLSKREQMLQSVLMKQTYFLQQILTGWWQDQNGKACRDATGSLPCR